MGVCTACKCDSSHTTEEIGLGELSVEIDDMSRSDEIGQWAHAFQRPVYNLRLAMTRLRARQSK